MTSVGRKNENATRKHTSLVHDTSAAVTGRPRHTTCTGFPWLSEGTIRPTGVSTTPALASTQHCDTSFFEFSVRQGSAAEMKGHAQRAQPEWAWRLFKISWGGIDTTISVTAQQSVYFFPKMRTPVSICFLGLGSRSLPRKASSCRATSTPRDVGRRQSSTTIMIS